MPAQTRSHTPPNLGDAFVHIVKIILEQKDDDPLPLALAQLGYDSVSDLLTMEKDEIMELKYLPKDPAVPATPTNLPTPPPRKSVLVDVPKKTLKKLLHFTWWHASLAEQKMTRSLTPQDFVDLTADDFQSFVQVHAPRIALTGHSTNSHASLDASSGAVTNAASLEWQKGHRRDIKVYSKWNGESYKWFRIKDNWKTSAALDGVLPVITEPVPRPGTEAKVLYDQQNQYLFGAFSAAVSGGQAQVIVRTHAPTMDGKAVFEGIVQHYERNANVMLMKTECITELNNMRLTNRYPGGPTKFFQKFQTIYLDYDAIARNSKSGTQVLADEDKIATLNAALNQDERFASIRSTMDTMALQTGQELAFEPYLQAFITHAENIKKQSRQDRHVNSNQASRPSARSQPNWKSDLTAHVPPHEYRKLSPEERKKRYEAKKRKKAASSNSSTTSSAPSSAPPRQIAATNTTPSADAPSVHAPAPPPPPASDMSAVSAVTQPTIANIMSASAASRSALPAGTYTDASGRQFHVTALRRIHLSALEVDAHDNLCLVDGGANNGLAGAAMRLLEQPEHPEMIDVVGASDRVESGMQSLPIGTYCAVVTSARGKRLLGVFPNFVGYGKGKSILSKNQSLAFGLQIFDSPRKYGGKQKIVSTEQFTFRLRHQSALTHLPIEYPSDTDLDQLPRVHFCSPAPWNPDAENDASEDDEWFACSSDEDELDDATFWDSRDGYYLPEHELSRPRYATAALLQASRQVSAVVKGFASAPAPRDYDSLRPFFAWKPVDVIKRTFLATTQFAQNVLRYPMRRHYKTRFPALRVHRLDEVYATDTFFSQTTAHDGSTCCQLYCGRKSYFTSVYGMKSEYEMPGSLMDFIRQHGAMKGLFSDNARVQTGHAVRDILRQYGIADMQSEPHQQNQNPAERRIQEVKKMTNVVLDRTGAPRHLWLLCLLWCVYVLNHLSHATLSQRTPLEVAFGATPDISAMLCFHFYQPVLYWQHDAPFPATKERLGRFVGISENTGDALTFQILTDDTNEVIHRSVVRPADDPDNPNRHLVPENLPTAHGEPSADPVVYSATDAAPIEPERLQLPTVDPLEIIGRTFLLEREVDGTVHRAEVTKRLKQAEDEAEQYLVRVGDGRQEVMTYNAVLEALNAQLEREANQTDEERMWIFKEVQEHRKRDGKWEVLMKWEDDSVTWEPLSLIWKSDPVTLAKYASDNDLLGLDGWKRFRKYAKSKKKLSRLLRQVRLHTAKTAIRIKFGVRIPRTYEEAVEFDRMNGNTLWQDAVTKEMFQIYEYKTFKSLGKGTKRPPGYTHIRVHLIFDCKQDGRRKARLVCGGHLTGPSQDTYYSSVVSLRSMRMVVFLAELNELELCAGDIDVAYLTSYTTEKVTFTAGAEFAQFGHEGHTMMVVKACYGLKESGNRFHERLAGVLHAIGFVPSRADADVWMKDCNSHYEYVCTYVDDLLYAGKDPTGFYDTLKTHGFNLKGVEEPKYHLGGNFARVDHPEKMLTWGSATYVKRMMANYHQMFGEPVPKRKTYSPLEPGDHPELDTSPALDHVNKKHYWSMIGELQWAVSLGRMDIACATQTMSRFRPEPREGHLLRLKRIYQYLRTYQNTAIKFNVEMPDYSQYKTTPANWGHVYGDCREDIPSDMPVPKGKPVLTTSFVDANLMHDVTTGRSCTGVIHMLNKTPIEWFSKRQNTVETATYGSEFVAARIAVDQIIDLRYSLRMLGVPLTGPSWMFGDNLSVVNSSTMPNGKLQRRNNILNYHRVREAQAAGIVNFVHMNGKDNPADICTKFRSSREWYQQMKPLIFWRETDPEPAEHANITHPTEGSDKCDANSGS